MAYRRPMSLMIYFKNLKHTEKNQRSVEELLTIEVNILYDKFRPLIDNNKKLTFKNAHIYGKLIPKLLDLREEFAKLKRRQDEERNN